MRIPRLTIDSEQVVIAQEPYNKPQQDGIGH